MSDCEICRKPLYSCSCALEAMDRTDEASGLSQMLQHGADIAAHEEEINTMTEHSEEHKCPKCGIEGFTKTCGNCAFGLKEQKQERYYTWGEKPNGMAIVADRQSNQAIGEIGPLYTEIVLNALNRSTDASEKVMIEGAIDSLVSADCILASSDHANEIIPYKNGEPLPSLVVHTGSTDAELIERLKTEMEPGLDDGYPTRTISTKLMNLVLDHLQGVE